MNTIRFCTRPPLPYAVARVIRVARRASLLLLLSAAACQSNPTVSSDRLDAAVSSYEARDWKQALDQASSVQEQSSGVQRDQAAFVAGLASYQMGNYAEAERRFRVAEQSADAQTSGDSKVMLGDLMVRRNDYAGAAALYDAAAEKLTGESSRRAQSLAEAARDPSRSGKILTMAEPSMSMNGSPLDAPRSAPPATASRGGGDASADSAPAPPPTKSTKSPSAADTKAEAKPSKPAPKMQPKPAVKKQDAPDPAAFVIQAGSFVLESSAKNRAKDLTKAAARLKIEAPWVAPSKSKSGQKVWIVYVGEFETRAAAEKAIKQLGRKDLIVVPNPD